LRALFESYGSVASVTVVKDRDTGEPSGFAFVEMRQDSEAQAAISALQGALLIADEWKSLLWFTPVVFPFYRTYDVRRQSSAVCKALKVLKTTVLKRLAAVQLRPWPPSLSIT